MNLDFGCPSLDHLVGHREQPTRSPARRLLSLWCRTGTDSVKQYLPRFSDAAAFFPAMVSDSLAG